MIPNNPFQKVSMNKPGKSVFDLSYSKRFDCYHGALIPICKKEVIPGDEMTISCELISRMLPLVSPVLHEINIRVHYFFYPYRLRTDDTFDWVEFITGGKDGDDSQTLPTWQPTDTTIHSLWDYMGFPIGVDPAGHYPCDMLISAYNEIYNNYYRDQNLITEADLDGEDVHWVSWGRDYFTSALESQQRGDSPALPISGTIEVDGLDEDITVYNETDSTPRTVRLSNTPNINTLTTPSASDDMRWSNPAMEVNLATAVTFDVSDLRLAFQLQKWQERNMRAGVRHKEFIGIHYGEELPDYRAQIPEYIGGVRFPIVISPILQTSATGIGSETTPQGNLAGEGLVADSGYIGKLHAKEFGLLMGVMSIVPKTMYSQGIPAEWIRESRFDYPFPEFAGLSEQAITRGQIFANGVTGDNNTIFGYIGRFDECRISQDEASGSLAKGQSLDFWTLGREFDTFPTLNQTFIECKGDDSSQTRIFADQTSPGYIISIKNNITAVRPLPIESRPGFLDE